MMNIKRCALILLTFTATFGERCFAQTNIQITSFLSTFEHAIQLTWTSISNEVYAIDEADALNSNPDGTTAWNRLYSNYPSQGSNTFWLDTGNYNALPLIVHPKFAQQRFYRIVDTGPDTTSTEPTVSITSPTNGFLASGMLTITVSASTDQATISTKLYVDGQEMNMSKDGTNYYINTCEWPNGNHIIFATAECQSAFGDSVDNGTINIGHAVSPFVTVQFNNLVEAISFSQVYFDPLAGQTQQVAALFARNSDWTLNITDVYTNVVKTTNGSGKSMQYKWDGTDNTGSNLPAGLYYYYISAATNGLAVVDDGGDGGGGGSPPSPSFASSMSLAGNSNDSEIVPLPPLPPGLPYQVDENGNPITTIAIPIQPTMFNAGTSLLASSFSSSELDSGYSSGGFGAPNDLATPPSPQTNPPAPERPPTAPMRGVRGTFGLAYQTYGTNGAFLTTPDNGFGVGERIQMRGSTAGVTYASLKQFGFEANNFVAQMQKGGWTSTMQKVDDKLQISDLTGPSNVFNGANLGLLMLHGTYGTSPDYNGNANGTEGIYFIMMNNGNPKYVRFSGMTSFGSSGTNGLKWMAVNACFSMNQSQWSAMVNNNIAPINNNLHMLLGCDSITYENEKMAAFWAEYMLGAGGVVPMEVRQAWYQAGTDAFGISKPPMAIVYSTAGFSSSFHETVDSTNAPSGGKFYDTATVYTP